VREGSWRRNDLVNNCLSSTNPNSLRFPTVPSSSRLSQGHIIHAHLTYGNTGEHTEVKSHKHEA